MKHNLPLAGMLICLFIFQPSLLFAQQPATPCETQLNQARDAFNAGLLSRIPDLEDCIRNERKDYRTRALKLLVLIHLIQDEDSLARRQMTRLLRNDPEFEPEKGDSRRFQFLYQEYRTEPSLTILGFGGINYTGVRTLRRYDIGNALGGNPRYSQLLNFHIGAAIYKPVNKHWWTGIEVGFVSRGFVYSQRLQTDPSLRLNFTSIRMTEKHNWLDVNGFFRYQFNGFRLFRVARIVPYLYAGGGFHYIRNPRITSIERLADDRRPDPPLVELTTDKAEIDLSDSRQPVNFSVSGGGGVMAKISLGFITLDVRYTQFLRNLADPAHRYDNNQLQYLFGYVDDDFLTNSTIISVGYIRNFYRPKLRKKVIKKPGK